jgi:gamma-glutamylputrescine oxidase
LYRTDILRTMLSFWENNRIQSPDFAVIGAGIMGCSVAYELRQRFPESSITLLERGTFPCGASGKNAGFLCFGSPTEFLHDIDLMGEQHAVELVRQRYEGIKLLRDRLDHKAIEITSYGGYELLDEQLQLDDTKLTYLNELLYPYFRQTVFENAAEQLKSFGFSDTITQLIACPLEQQIDSGKMLLHYHALLAQLNIQLLCGAEVKSIEANSIEIESAVSGNFSIAAAQIFICTNAFITDLVPEIPVSPGRGQVVITKEMDNLPFKGSFHFDEGFYYFRNIGKRVLFGGGRNLDMETERSHLFVPNERILDDLTAKLTEIILPCIPFEIDYSWQGIMAFTEHKQPLIQKVNNVVTYVMACNGMGVALSPYIARQAVEQL